MRRDLRYMLADGIAFSVMVGIGESYVAPFALALGFDDVTAGLIATAPMLIGAVFQLVTPAAVGLLGSHKRWVVICAGLQAATFLPLVAGALGGSMSIAALYIATSLYWGLGMATSPAWNTWAGTLVPRGLRAGYFARRSRWAQAALLAGFALGAYLLHEGDRLDRPLDAFALVFAAALVARLISTTYLSRQSEPEPIPLGDTRISPRAAWEHAHRDGHARLLVYLFVFQLAVWIAAPFFTPYMLGPLGLDYSEFAVLTGVAFLSRVAVLPAIGRYIQSHGTRRVLQLGSVGIVPLPLLWLLSDSFVWLFGLQLFSGVVWAAFELATLLAFFEHIPVKSRTSVLSAYNLLNAAAIAGGCAIGALLLSALGSSATAFAVVLGVSSAARASCLLLARRLEDVVPPSGQDAPALRTLTVRPSSGAVQRPVLPDLPEDAD